MNIKEQMMTRVVLSDIPLLDPVTLLLDQVGPKSGRIIVDCADHSWSASWGNMGGDLIRFIHSSDSDYIIDCLHRGLNSKELDYVALSEIIGNEIGHKVHIDYFGLLEHESTLIKLYGEDWRYCLPQRDNERYTYLERIVNAVKEYAKTKVEQEATAS